MRTEDRMMITVKFHILNERVTQHTIPKGLRVHHVQFGASLEAIFDLGATILLAIHDMLVLKHSHYHSMHHLVIPSLILIIMIVYVVLVTWII